jgi:hypothetical protein
MPVNYTSMPPRENFMRKISFAYPIHYSKRRGGRITRSWVRETTDVEIRVADSSELQLAFKITRQNGGEPSIVDVFANELGLWWPLTEGDDATSVIDAFFDALQQGKSDALGLIGAGIRPPIEQVFGSENELKICDRLYSGLDEMLARVQRASQNILICGGNRKVYIRGGDPIFFFRPSAKRPPETVSVEICNSGFEFGQPTPIVIPANCKFDGTEWDRMRGSIRYGEVCGLSQIGDLRREFDRARLIQPVQVEAMLCTGLLDPLACQLQLLCRDLIDRLEKKKDMPPEIFHGLKLFRGIGRDRLPTARECDFALREFRRWCRTLDTELRGKLNGEYHFLALGMKLVGKRRLQLENIFPPSYLAPEDDEAIANLLD